MSHEQPSSLSDKVSVLRKIDPELTYRQAQLLIRNSDKFCKSKSYDSVCLELGCAVCRSTYESRGTKLKK